MLAQPPNLVANRYELLSRLGEGGMGVVDAAYDRLTGSRVALKRVPLAPAPDAATMAGAPTPAHDSTNRRKVREALATEFHTLAALRHPSIISVLDYGFDREQTPFFTMELLTAPRTLVAAGADLQLAEQIELVAQLLRALAYLHRHHIVHRDLKPSNVLVVERGRTPTVKVLDFGIAAPRGTAVAMAGTLEYMAPEVLYGQAPTEAADLYAVGVMLHQMLIGRYPHEQTGRTVTQTVVDEPSAPAELANRLAATSVASLPEPLRAVMQRLLALEPRQRYSDPGQVLADLGAVLGRPLQVDTAETRESFLSASVLVGRERELATLSAALAGARRGAGSAILLAGESGVGKSRLLDEVRSVALVRGVRVLRGQSISTAGGSYDVFLDVLRALVLDTPLHDLEAAVLKELLPELPALLGTPIPDAPSVGPQATSQRLRRVLLAVLTRPQEPVLLLLEDIQWAAQESLELLRELVTRVQNLPLLLIASVREDEHPDLAGTLPGATLLRLPRLDQSAIAALSQSMLGPAGTQPELLALLSRETEGNVLVSWFLRRWRCCVGCRVSATL